MIAISEPLTSSLTREGSPISLAGSGMLVMKQDGYMKVVEGVTSIDEVLRVAQE